MSLIKATEQLANASCGCGCFIMFIGLMMILLTVLAGLLGA